MAIFVKEMLNFGNSCRETQFFQILVLRAQKFGKFCPENATHGTFGVEISLAKGIIFRKIGLANGRGGLARVARWRSPPGPLKAVKKRALHKKNFGILYVDL